ncbi:MAG: hypothetical protein ABJN69_11865 [Hellea sp.]
MYRLKLFTLALGTVALTLSAAPQAWAQIAGQPDELQAIYACKTIADPQERLACYDNSVGLFQAAEKSGEVVAVSKTAIENVERDAFGFNIPSLPSLGRIFGGGKDKAPSAPKESDLTAPVKRAEATQIVKQPTRPPEVMKRPTPSEVSEVTLQIRKMTTFGYKKTRFFMTNGQVWEQIDANRIRISKSQKGKTHTAVISKAALGSFLLKINDKGSDIRVKRVR